MRRILSIIVLILTTNKDFDYTSVTKKEYDGSYLFIKLIFCQIGKKN